LESAFLQESDSAVFGKLQRRGKLQLARGGKLRVAYDRGLVLVSDGKRLVQYDPDARTAQALDLAQAAAQTPLVNLLMNPRRLQESYTASAEGGAVRLRPTKGGLPEVRVEPKGGLPGRIEWTDGTGSKQVLVLVDARVPSTLPEAAFRFEAPKGTRWLGKP
jgi:outer membrane lipoprotein-sorting protein